MRTKETMNVKESLDQPWMADEEPASEVDLVDLLYRLVDKAKYVLLAAVVFGLTCGFWAKQQVQTIYFAEASLYILNNTDELTLSDIQLANNMMSNYIAIFTNKEVHQRVIDRLHLSYTADQIAGMVSVANVPDTHILNIQVTTDHEQEAVPLANTYAEVASEFIDQVMNTGRMTVWEEASAVEAVQTPDVGRSTLYGVFAGAVLAFAVVVVQVLLDDRIRMPAQIEKGSGIPVLGVMTCQRKNWEGESYEFCE